MAEMFTFSLLSKKTLCEKKVNKKLQSVHFHFTGFRFVVLGLILEEE